MHWSVRAVPGPRRAGGVPAGLAGPLVALALLSGCGALPMTPPAAPTVTPAAGTDGVLRVRLDHGAGAAPVVVLPRGRTVELVVGSDVAVRVLLSGFDRSRYVTAGGTVTMRFVPDRPGELTVTVGGSGELLGRLDVR